MQRLRFEDEVQDLSAHSDVFSLTVAPADEPVEGVPPRRRSPTDGSKTHLWLVSTDDVVAAIEEGEAGQSTLRGRLAHTNLSGGRDAHAGGELWFSNDSRLWLTGGSSRYESRSADELGGIVEAFRTSGYTVCSCGWDDENDKPARFFRGPDEWLEAHG